MSTHREWTTPAGLRLRISTPAPGVWRVQSAAGGGFDDRGAAQQHDPAAAAPPRPFDDAPSDYPDIQYWQAGGDRLEVNRATGVLTFRGGDFPLGGLNLSFDLSGGGVAVEVALVDGERLLGLGERLDSCDQRGQAVEVPGRDGDRIASADGRGFMPTPFFYSTRRYGILLNRPEGSRLDLGRSRPAVARLEQLGAPLDVYVLSAATPTGILRRQRGLTRFLRERPPAPDAEPNPAPGGLRGWDFLRARLTARLSAGLSGVPFASFDPAPAAAADFPGQTAAGEGPVAMYLRAVQLAAFASIMPGVEEARRRGLPAAALAVHSAYAALHGDLAAYRREQEEPADGGGAPLMRHLAIDFPDDLTAEGCGTQYLYGASVLVAPVLTAGLSRDLYLPAGGWFDPWSGARYEGGRWLWGYEAPLPRVPFFLRVDHESVAWREVAPAVAARVDELKTLI